MGKSTFLSVLTDEDIRAREELGNHRNKNYISLHLANSAALITELD